VESSKATTMRVLVLLLLSLLLLFLESAIAIGQFCGTNAGCIYPMPSSVVQTPSGIPPTISPANFSVSCIPECHQGCQNIVVPALARVFKRVFRRIGHVQVSETTKITSVVVTLSSLSATPLQHGVNESYSLSLPAAGPSMAVSIVAASEWGALRALETFAQAITLLPGTAHGFFNTSTPAYFVTIWPHAQIHDAPRTAWRGLLIDTSRHFLSRVTIEHTIEAMAMSKMNLLHWHIVDGDGWPLCINATQRVCDQHAYLDPSGERAGYTKAQLVDVVEFARARGVRVMPEFDLPGHIATPFCSAEPELCVAGCAPDPSSAKWWEYLERVVAELGEIFTDDWFHGGADEFRPQCWFESPALKTWAQARNMSTPTDLLNYFHTRWQKILLAAGKRPMFWDEFFWVYDGSPPTRTNLTVLPGTTASLRGVTADAGALIKTEYAGDEREWEQSLAAGIPTINTGISEMWYLDRVGKICGSQPGGIDPKVSGGHSYFWQTWQTYHDHDPYAKLSDEVMSNTSLMLGGEVNMWGEGIDDTNFESFVFPATLAAAERMWSVEPNPAGAEQRLSSHRCAVVGAGVRVAPIGPGPPCGLILK